METVKDRRRFVLFLIHCCLVVSLAETMAAALLIEISFFVRFLIILGIASFVTVVLHYPFVLLYAAPLPLAGAYVIRRFFNHWTLIIYERISHFVMNLLAHLQGREIILPENALVMWVLLTGAAAFFTVLMVFRKHGTWPVLVVYCSFFLIYWYNFVDRAYPMLILFLVAYVVLISLKQLQRQQQRWTGEAWTLPDRLETPWLRTAFTYAVIIVLLAALLPAQGPWLQWRWMENRLVQRFPALEDLRGDVAYSRSLGRGDLFDFRITGFQEGSNTLGGPARMSDRLVMRVKAEEPLYLRGNVKTLYRDNAWHPSPANAVTLPTGQDFPFERDPGNFVWITVTHENFASRTVFAPYQPIRIESSRYDEVSVDERFQIIFPEAVYKHESYQVAAMIPGGSSHQDTINELSQEYLQLPDELPDRISDLTYHLTEGLTDPYEKALALQQHLRTHYAYSLKSPHTPESRDFVDHFLFDLRQGYCTHFATALNLMLRLEGIPSRYVEGYLMPQVTHDDVYEIRQHHAHAWTEAFFEGRGWTTLEATPAFAMPETLSGETDWVGGSYSPDDAYNEFLLLYESAVQAEGGNGTGMEEEQADNLEGVHEADEGTLPALWQSRHALSVLLFILGAALLALAAGATVQANRYRLHWKQLQHLTPNQQAVILYQNTLELLKILGHGIVPGETSYEYARRIAKELYDVKSEFESLTTQYILAQYSREELDEEALPGMKAYLDYIDQRVRHKLGIRAYFIRKYLRRDYLTCCDALNQRRSCQ